MIGLIPEFPSVEHSHITFEYQKQNRRVPIATSLTDFKEIFHKTTLPSLDGMKKTCLNTNDKADLAFSRFYYPGDDLDEQSPKAAAALREFFKFGGAPVSDVPIKIDRWMPTRASMLEWMRSNPDHYIPMNDFLGSSFIVAPAIIHDKEWVTYSEDAKTITSDLAGGVLIDGRSILEFIQPEKNRDRVYFGDLTQFLDSMSTPINYSLGRLDPTSLAKT